jgi:HAD superfamily hydrolase (TIGR01490 family)
MTLILFDLDDTLLAGDTEAAWANYMSENMLILDKSFHLKMEQFEDQYRKGELDVVEYTQYLLSPIVGKSEEEVSELVRSFSQIAVNRFRDRLTDSLLKTHSDDECLISSGTLSFLVKEIASILGIKTYFGTDAELRDGFYTGKVKGRPNFEDEKVKKIRHWLGKRQVEAVTAYSDSVHDLPLLTFADKAVAVNPDDHLRRIALEKGWKIDDTRLIG